MILDWIWSNFGFIEYVICIELVIMLSAAFFYQVAKLIARTNRQDPLVKFYRVFWQAFFSPVKSVRELDLIQIEIMARYSGLSVAGELDDKQLRQLDAPDLTSLDGLADYSEKKPEADDGPKAIPIGRTGPESEDRVRPKPNAESRELRFARQQKEKREQQRQSAKLPPDVDDDSERISVVQDRERTHPSAPSPEVRRAATSRCQVRIVPFKGIDRIIGLEAGEVVIEVMSAPEDGQANAAIITLLAERLLVRPYQVALVGGHYKVRKTLQIAGLDQATLDQRLSQLQRP
jgi:uncharacterized protein YggU (UPF0235/DUF167 family)